MDTLFDQSHALAGNVIQLVARPIYDERERFRVSNLSCSLAFEHGEGAKLALACGLLPSAAMLHRAQFEAVLRAVWVLYAASDEQVGKLGADLTAGSEQAAKHLPTTAKMMDALVGKAPPEPLETLVEFKAYNWQALNSYAHAGIHAISSHRSGLSSELLFNVLLNINGLLVFTAMQAAILTGVPNLQRLVLQTAAQYPQLLSAKPST
ncbi:hypothetical protein [Pseudoxanthomonas sp. GM95]|uniref:DUF6988 family protein n=1 Tax=Pseudoxanthomonas sp. GM95 TaxID=1881043 RepID=UPI0011141464|nr:hypothetical protein [Pseudoxanthomonas sp. GM95]